MGKLKKPKAAGGKNSKNLNALGVLAAGGALLAAALAVQYGVKAATPKEGLSAGLLAPPWEGTTHTGEMLSLRLLRGKNILLWFYPRASTSGCTAEGLGFQELLPQFKLHNVEVIGVSNDDAAANTAFAQANGFDYPLLCDTSLAISTAYGAAEPGAHFARRAAVLIGVDGRVRRYFPDVVDAAGFPAEVLRLV